MYILKSYGVAYLNIRQAYMYDYILAMYKNEIIMIV